MFKVLSWSASIVLAATAAVALPQKASAADTASAASVLASLARSAEATAGYDRTLFQHWDDADGDGCDTRSEVLQEESKVPVTMSSGCTVATGEWVSRYDGQTWTNASNVDIDHMVPLAEAWGSGAHAWTDAQRRDFANDMILSVALEAVTDSVNQSKGDRDPGGWMPPKAGTACDYATDWVLVKYRWRLTVDQSEHGVLSRTLSGECGARDVTLPDVAVNTPAPITFKDVTPPTSFSDEIAWLAGRGVTTGWEEQDGSRTYRPYDFIERNAMAAFLYRLAGKPEFTAPAVSPFADVTPSTPFYKEITWLADKKISTGWDEPDGRKTFRPYQSVNRDAMAAFLYRFAGNPYFEPPATSAFIDVATDHGFYRQISWLAARGISTGWPMGYGCYAYDPYWPVTRDAMAAFMYRLINQGAFRLEGSGCTPPPSSSPAPQQPAPQQPAPQQPAPQQPANPGDSKNCGDFRTWREAQDWFEYYYPYYGDVAGLDRNYDGIACESLPGAP